MCPVGGIYNQRKASRVVFLGKFLTRKRLIIILELIKKGFPSIDFGHVSTTCEMLLMSKLLLSLKFPSRYIQF